MVSNVNVYGLRESIIASSYPMMKTPMSEVEFSKECYEVLIDGNKKFQRAIQLAQTGNGEGHDNFLNGIIVQFDLTLPVKVWTELQRYHFIDFVSSMSTMHRLTQMDLTNTYDENVDERIVNVMMELQKEYEVNPTPENKLKLLMSNPNGCELTARMTTNYRQLKTIYNQRNTHFLPQWKEFCKFVKTLPYAKDLICFDREVK